MFFWRFLPVALPLLLAAAPSPAASEPLPPEVIRSVVLLSAPGSHTCATGFLLPDERLVTNVHVIESLCPQRDCTALTLRVARAPGTPAGEQLSHGPISIERSLPALDLAVLRAPGTQSGLTTAQAVIEGDIAVLSYPACRTLELSRGERARSDVLHHYTTALAAHGSSGAPLLTSSFAVVGVVDEAATVTGALGSLLLGRRFEARAVRLELLESLRAVPPDTLLARQSEILVEAALESLPTSLQRARRSVDVVAAVSALSRSPEAQASRSLLTLAEASRTLQDLPGEPIAAEDTAALLLERAVFAAAVLYRGTAAAPRIISSLEGRRPSGHLAELRRITRVQEEAGWAGLESFLIVRGTLAGGVLLLLGVWIGLRVLRRRTPPAPAP